MGIAEDEQKKNQEQRLQLKGKRNVKESAEVLMQMNNSEISTAACRSEDNFVSCCQENENFSCCGNRMFGEKISSDAIETEAKLSADNKSSSNKTVSRVNSGSKGGSRRKYCSKPTWLDSWEREDTYAALAVVCAGVSVAIAYSCYKQLK